MDDAGGHGRSWKTLRGARCSGPAASSQVTLPVAVLQRAFSTRGPGMVFGCPQVGSSLPLRLRPADGARTDDGVRLGASVPQLDQIVVHPQRRAPLPVGVAPVRVEPGLEPARRVVQANRTVGPLEHRFAGSRRRKVADGVAQRPIRCLIYRITFTQITTLKGAT